MSAFKKTDLYQGMKRAISHIAEVVNEVHEEPEAGQETNIFKILRLENYEIRHGNFLEYLMDPKRNVVLAKDFIWNFLYEIIEHLEIDDKGFNRIIAGDDFEISKVAGESRYTEIPAGEDKKQRIDHAFELKIGRIRRVLVFEYKLNGVLQNDLEAYQNTIEGCYENVQFKPYYFILELGSKKHNLSNKGEFKFIPKDALVKAVRDTVSDALKKDMLATKLYLEQYLEIIEPEVKDEFLLAGLEKELWGSWNPAMDDYEDAYKAYESLVEDYIEGEDHQVALWGYYYSEVFDRRVKQELEGYSSHLHTKLNQGWLRILPHCRYKDFYFWTSVFEGENEGEIYLTINFQAYHNRKASLEKAEEQKAFLIQLLNNSVLAKPMNSIESIESCKILRINQDLEVVEEIHHKDDNKYPHEFRVHYRRSIDTEALKNICTLEASEEFDLMMKDLFGFIDLIDKAA